MTLFIKKLSATAIVPTRAHDDDAGLDVYASIDAIVPACGWAWVSTGIAMAVAPGFCARVCPRSGLAGEGITVDAGVIDAGYRGEVKVLLVNRNDYCVTVTAGQKIAQILIQPIARPTITVVDELPPSERGDKGFGSTGDGLDVAEAEAVLDRVASGEESTMTLDEWESRRATGEYATAIGFNSTAIAEPQRGICLGGFDSLTTRE